MIACECPLCLAEVRATLSSSLSSPTRSTESFGTVRLKHASLHRGLRESERWSRRRAFHLKFAPHTPHTTASGVLGVAFGCRIIGFCGDPRRLVEIISHIFNVMTAELFALGNQDIMPLAGDVRGMGQRGWRWLRFFDALCVIFRTPSVCVECIFRPSTAHSFYCVPLEGAQYQPHQQKKKNALGS